MRSRSRPVAASRWADSSAISSPRRSISAAVIRKSLFIGDSSVGLRRLYTAIFEAFRRRQDGRSPAVLDFFRRTPVLAALGRREARWWGIRQMPGIREHPQLSTLSREISRPLSAVDRIGYGSAATLRLSVVKRGSPSRPTRTSGTRPQRDRKSTRLNSSHLVISYAVFCLKKKKNKHLKQ